MIVNVLVRSILGLLLKVYDVNSLIYCAEIPDPQFDSPTLPKNHMFSLPDINLLQTDTQSYLFCSAPESVLCLC